LRIEKQLLKAAISFLAAEVPATYTKRSILLRLPFGNIDRDGSVRCVLELGLMLHGGLQ
jgi:hypothetical protein